MLQRWGIEAVDRSLRLLTKTDELFGGKIVVFGGDFRQVLPVLPKASRTEIVSKLIKRSEQWNHMEKLRLTINERVARGGNADSSAFASLTLAIGENRVPIQNQVNESSIEIPEEYLFHSDNIEHFIEWTYNSFQFTTNGDIGLTAILAPKMKMWTY